MARIRTVKPAFWSHPIMGRLPDAARLLAIALLNFADDEGYFYADPVVVRNFARPFDDDSRIIHGSITELSRAGWIEVREHATHGKIGWVVNFTSHQLVNRPQPSVLAKYFADSVINHGSITERSQPEGKGREEEEEGKTTLSKAAPPTPAPVLAIFDHWRAALSHPTAKLDPKRRRCIEAALKLGYTQEQLCSCIDGYSRDPFTLGQNDRATRFDALTLFLRDAEHIDKGLRLHEAPAPAAKPAFVNPRSFTLDTGPIGRRMLGD